MVAFLSRWLDARIRRVVQEEAALVRFDMSGLSRTAEAYVSRVATAACETARRAETLRG
jgi:hypothetical protein